jgi:phosphate transport system protein
MSDHIVKAFDEELQTLKNMLARMGGLAEEELARAIDAISRRDGALADQVIASDAQVDALEREIEERAILVIARRQPMASDLREIMVAIRVSSDLERIGDFAKNIAKRTHAVSEDYPRRVMTGITRMGSLALEQLKDVLDAYVQHNEAKALEVWRKDEELDALYNSIFRELLTYMMEDPRTIGLCTHLLFAAKNIERIGDHCTNIAENVYYLVHGRQLTAERPKGDITSITPVATPEK